jgi:hypothetical protein
MLYSRSAMSLRTTHAYLIHSSCSLLCRGSESGSKGRLLLLTLATAEVSSVHVHAASSVPGQGQPVHSFHFCCERESRL